MKLLTGRNLLRLALAGSLALSARATVIVATSSLHDGSVFTVSNSDLFQTNLSAVTPSTNNPFNGPLSVLTNGAFGAAGNAGSSDTWGFGPVGGTLTFSFNLSVNTLGYTLTNLRSYAGWDHTYDGQEYTVSYSTVGAPGTFTTLTTIPQFNPPGTGPVPGGLIFSHTLVSLTDTSGVLASGVAAVRYTFTGIEFGATAYREFDAFGSPTTAGGGGGGGNVPDAGSTAALLALGFGALGFARRAMHGLTSV